MQAGEVAHVDDPESEVRNARRAALQEALNDLNRSEVCGGEHGAEDRARKNRGQFGCTGVAVDKVPCGTFRKILESL